MSENMPEEIYANPENQSYKMSVTSRSQSPRYKYIRADLIEVDVEKLKNQVFENSDYAFANREILQESNLTVAGVIVETIDHLLEQGIIRGK